MGGFWLGGEVVVWVPVGVVVGLVVWVGDWVVVVVVVGGDVVVAEGFWLCM